MTSNDSVKALATPEFGLTRESLGAAAFGEFLPRGGVQDIFGSGPAFFRDADTKLNEIEF